MRCAVILALAIISASTAYSQTTWYVPDDFPAGIQAAISDTSVMDGDTIMVRPGTYGESIDLMGKAIRLAGSNGPGATTIEGGGYGTTSVVTVANGEGSDTVIEGFTITNGWSTEGGGIFCDHTSPTIRHNIITGNSCGDVYLSGSGGGIFSNGGSPLIHDNWITGNGVGSHYGSSAGGGLYCTEGAPLVKENLINDNFGGYGGAISCIGATTVENNTIVNNRALYGSGIRCYGAAVIVGNIISFNRESPGSTHGYGGGIYCQGTGGRIDSNLIRGNSNYYGGGGICCYSAVDTLITNNTIYGNYMVVFSGGVGGGLYVERDSTVTGANNIIWANEDEEIYLDSTFGSPTLMIHHSDVEGGLSGVVVESGATLNWMAGMIDQDPCFVEPGPPGLDLHLTFPSPCRNSGDNSAVIGEQDFEGDTRIAHGTVDMGADEFHPHLYFTGDAEPAGAIQVKCIGLPGSSLNGIILGVNIFDPPLPCDYGLWYMDNPMQIIVGLGNIPVSGVALFPGTLPATPSGPYTFYLQAAIDSWLTNLCTVVVE